MIQSHLPYFVLVKLILRIMENEIIIYALILTSIPSDSYKIDTSGEFVIKKNQWKNLK